MSFKDMKSRSKKGFEKLNKELEKINTSNSSFKDDRIWKATQDKSGNGYAVIRFLPAPEGEDVPWVRRFNHGFKGPGGWCIENCPTTIDGSCPICEANSELWNSGTESNKNIARDRKRKLSYYANILVVSDSTHPENDGKVFLFRFGKKIFDKIQEAMNPEFEDENPVNPFDFWEGANFKLKIRKVAGFTNYDKSEFESPSALLGGDDANLETLWKTEYPLLSFIESSEFKDYDTLKERMTRVLRGGASPASAEITAEAERLVDAQFDNPDNVAKVTPIPVSDNDDDDDESESTLEYLEKLAAGEG